MLELWAEAIPWRILDAMQRNLDLILKEIESQIGLSPLAYPHPMLIPRP